MGGLFGGGGKSAPQVVYQQPAPAPTPIPAATITPTVQSKDNTLDTSLNQKRKRSTLLTQNEDMLGTNSKLGS